MQSWVDRATVGIPRGGVLPRSLCPLLSRGEIRLSGVSSVGRGVDRSGPRVSKTQAVAETSGGIACARSIPHLEGGSFRKDGHAFVEQFRIRGYEVGPDRQTTLPTIANLLQENASNHAICMWGKTEEGFAAEPSMVEKGLILVMTRLQIQVDKYPTWGDVIEVETWFSTESRASAKRDWAIRDAQTGETIGRATSTWVMVDIVKRKMARIPEEMKENFKQFVSPERHSVAVSEARQKLPNMSEDSTPGPDRFARGSNVDMNGHINNVVYLIWALDTVPDEIHDSKTLTEMEMDFKAECVAGDRVESSWCEIESENGSTGTNVFLHSLRKVTGEKSRELIRVRTKWS
ncbi:hypothetical protein BSKO_11392 [Bryopsis sp. KO-2023]|nr:hypothetical protein BSKO_11392 [Bryopsis sp. KO-2023]